MGIRCAGTGSRPVRRSAIGWILILILLALATVLLWPQFTKKPSKESLSVRPTWGQLKSMYQPTASVATASEVKPSGKTHRVRRGQFLRWIAQQYGVDWEAMLLLNEPYLKVKYDETCARLSYRYRNTPGRRGTFCNDRYGRPYGNTLKASWVLQIPSNTAPASINQVVDRITGQRVALVIDDTGSMNDDRREVGAFYTASLRQHSKHLVGVWLYSDGQVRKYNADGVEFLTEGSVENTFGALKQAAKASPDDIILISDEPGDDWGDWSGVRNLPRITAHCLPSGGRCACETNLRRLATETHGQYVEGLK